MSIGELTSNLVEFVGFRTRRLLMGVQISEVPHFDPDSAQWFAEQLAKAKNYLEFGGGGSTFEAARLGVPTITVENDRAFARALQKKLPLGSEDELVISELGLTRKWGKPVFTAPTPKRVKRWSRYVNRPFELLAERSSSFPDLVLVDGRLRAACALETARRAAMLGVNTTLCVDDYTDRPALALLADQLGQPVLHGRMAVFQLDERTPQIARALVEKVMADYN
jgi:hypothetical protein